MQLTDQEKVRRENLDKIRELGINPFPAEQFEINASAKQINEEFNAEAGNFQEVSLAGRLMMKRIMGKASFAEVQDSSGKIQVYINRDEICPGEDKTMYNTVFKKLLDLGDFIGVTGHAFVTQTGTTSIHVTSLKVLSKSLKPLPVVKRDEEGNVYDASTDPELRYRMRYVDLTVNPEVRETFLKRTRLINAMRNFFNEKGWLEVETPILQPIHGGAAAAHVQRAGFQRGLCRGGRRHRPFDRRGCRPAYRTLHRDHL